MTSSHENKCYEYMNLKSASIYQYHVTYYSMALIYVNYDTTYCSPLVFGNQNEKFSLDHFTTCDIGSFAYVHLSVSLSHYCLFSFYRFFRS